jgi:hypothetical protein
MNGAKAPQSKARQAGKALPAMVSIWMRFTMMALCRRNVLSTRNDYFLKGEILKLITMDGF